MHADRPPSHARVKLVPEGIDVGGQVVPLFAAAVHYWRLEPGDWRRALDATRSLGFRLIDVYVPWSVHEVGPGAFDFGKLADERDVGAFIQLIGELGLHCILRPVSMTQSKEDSRDHRGIVERASVPAFSGQADGRGRPLHWVQ